MMVKLCKDCKYSEPELHTEWSLRCTHEEVNKNDPWALASNVINGSSAKEERAKKDFIFFRKPACGMSGKLWEAK